MASGPNGAKPHHRPGDRRIGEGELVVIDFGAIVDGYCSDMTRTVCVGRAGIAAPRPAWSTWWPRARGPASPRCGPAWRPGPSTRRAGRSSPRRAGPTPSCHGTGHGVGLEIHEDAPGGRRRPPTRSRAGHVVTVEPGVYLPEHGGVRIEDTVVVTDDGCTVLTHAPKDPDRRLIEASRMPNVTTNDLKNGMTLDLPEGLFTVVEFQHVKPGKGGAFVRTKLKNVRTGAVVDRTFRADEKVEQAIIDKREMQYLYRDGDDYVFMDNTTYDQTHVDAGVLGDAANYLNEGDTAILQMSTSDEIVGVDLPAVGRARRSPRPSRACRATGCSGARKPATLETGLVVQVPLFVNLGDRVKVDTRSGDYITRV